MSVMFLADGAILIYTCFFVFGCTQTQSRFTYCSSKLAARKPTNTLIYSLSFNSSSGSSFHSRPFSKY